MSEFEEDAPDLAERILLLMGELSTPGFFVTAECSRLGECMPDGLAAFVDRKLEVIRSGSEVRKFVFQEEGWRIILTFFPTDRVVDERYALKNKVHRTE